MNQIKQLLISLINKINLWEQNAKSIDELPASSSVVPTAKIHVSESGTSKSLELQKLIDAALGFSINQLTSIGEITVDGNDVTTPPATWKIANVSYSTSTDTITNHPFSATGTTRIDILVANTLNQILKVSGSDTVGIAIRPNQPLNTVIVTEINVSEDSLIAVPFPLSTNQIEAIQGANTPSASNPFATILDIVAGSLGSLAQTLTIGGREVRVIGTDSVLQSTDKSKVLICHNTDDFFLSIGNDNLPSLGDEFIILNPHNSIPPSITSIELPSGSEARLWYFSLNNFFLSIKAIGSGSSQNFQDVTTGTGNNETTNPVIFKKDANVYTIFNSADQIIEFWDITVNADYPIQVWSKDQIGVAISLNADIVGAATRVDVGVGSSITSRIYGAYKSFVYNSLGKILQLKAPTTITGDWVQEYPNKSGIFAMTSDITTAITNLKDGVASPGDTLQKLYNLYLGASAEVYVANIAARDAYNVPHLPFSIFVTDDGDGHWAKYQATTTGVGATFVKLSDPDLLNAVMNAAAIKAAYESNSDTNAFTNALKAIVQNQSGVNTGDETLATIVAKLGFTPDKPFSILSLNADYTGSGSTTLQKAFNVGSGGLGSYPALANKKYRMLMFLSIEAMSSTSGTMSVGVLGTATVDLFFGECLAKKSGTATSPATGQTTLINVSPTAVVTATTTTNGYMLVDVTFTTLSAGSVIPCFGVSQSATPVVKKPSWCYIQEIGPNNLTATPDIG
jgi:hypothetical protein